VSSALRISRERSGECYPLALAARDAGRPYVGERLDAEAGEQLVHALPPSEGDVLANGHVREERVLLEHQPDPAPLGGEVDAARGVEPRSPVQSDAPALGAKEAGDGTEQARLPRPGGPDEDEHLGIDRELEV
jgi:hypothetical protein